MSAASLPTSLPSIHDLGRRLAGLQAVYDANDSVNTRDESPAVQTRATAAREITFDQILAVQDVVATMPAVTLADAAVHVAVAANFAARIEGEAFSETELADIGTKIERMLLSILPVVAEAGGLSIEDMGWQHMIDLRASRFEALGAMR